jgi:uncharacterized Rmd1/YagE family protein
MGNDGIRRKTISERNYQIRGRLITYVFLPNRVNVAVASREDESFNYFVTTAYPPRVYNDVFIIRDAQNYMIKLSISHAIAQSVKVISLFRI